MKAIVCPPSALSPARALSLAVLLWGGLALPAVSARAQCPQGTACGPVSSPGVTGFQVVDGGALGDHCVARGPLAAAARCCASGCARCQFSPQGNSDHCGMPAPVYPVPFATPKPTVPTYYTYPPMMPHNSLHHYRGTYAYKHGPGMSRTTVHWRAPKGLNALKFLHHVVELPR